MPKYAEIIFEPGSKSLLAFEDEAELKRFLAEHHRRAVSGEPGAPQDQKERNDISREDFDNMPSVDVMKSRPAERIKRVLIYNEHPTDNYAAGVDADTLKSLVDAAKRPDGTVDEHQVVSLMRDETSPVYPVNQGRHVSQYKTQEDGELDLSFLNEAGA